MTTECHVASGEQEGSEPGQQGVAARFLVLVLDHVLCMTALCKRPFVPYSRPDQSTSPKRHSLLQLRETLRQLKLDDKAIF